MYMTSVVCPTCNGVIFETEQEAQNSKKGIGGMFGVAPCVCHERTSRQRVLKNAHGCRAQMAEHFGFGYCSRCAHPKVTSAVQLVAARMFGVHVCMCNEEEE